jgi:carboxypeptidase family protein
MAHFKSTTAVMALFAWLAVLSGTSAFTQAVTGTILGRVTDTSGAVIAGAAIQVQNVDTGFAQTTRTDSEGRYLNRSLPLGPYAITVQQPGFRTEIRRGIVLTVASEVVVNVELAVGNVQEKVEVTAEVPLIETTNATVSSLVSQDQLRDLPLNGRSIDNLALLSPGVISNLTTSRNATVGLGIHLSVNGARPDSLLYLLDGTVVNDATNNGHGSYAGQALGVEGILEFRLLTHSFTAEYGRSAGAVITAVTRAGTNDFHGSVYEFVRNNIFDARNFFNPGALPPFRRNQFGASAGGRIIKDKLFFFANYEGLRQRQGNTIIAIVPDANARRGLLPNAATGQLQQVTLNPAVVPYLNLYPLPNGPSQGDGTAQFLANFSAPATENYAMERMDWRISDNDNFYGRYVFDPSESITPNSLPTFVIPFFSTDHLVVLSETHVFSGASLNEFRSAFNRTARGQDSYPTVPIDPSLSFVPGQVLGTIQYGATNDISKGQLSVLGTASGANQSALQNLFQVTDTFTTVRGAHSLKFGVDLQRTQLNGALYVNPVRGAYVFGGLQGLLAGQATQFQVLLENGQSTGRRGFRRILTGWFVQDDFHLRPNLTLNLGLRHEFFTAPSEVNGRSSNLHNLTDAANTPGPPFLPSKPNFSPRVGLAWDPTGSGKTSVRLGAGVFYNQIDGRTWYGTATINADFLKVFQIANPPFPNPLANGLPAGALQNNDSVTYHADTPTIIQTNLEVQRQLARTLSLRAGYIGSYGYHLTRVAELNTRIPQILADGSKLFLAGAPRYNSHFASIQETMTDAHFNYNALQVEFQKTYSAGLTFHASYTYSKALSEADQIVAGQISSIPNIAMDPYDLGRDYSRSAYDQRHMLVVNGAYLMPWEKWLHSRLAKATLSGWAINGIYSYGSGMPIDMLTGFNNSLDANSTNPDRPNLTPGFSNNPIHRITAGCQGIPAGQKLQTPRRWFDPCAFTLNAAGTYGNLGRLTVSAPGLSQADISLVRTMPLTERKKLEFRAEFFNLLNHANFGLPNNAIFNTSRLRSGSAGLISSTTTDNRDIQLGLKLMF